MKFYKIINYPGFIYRLTNNKQIVNKVKFYNEDWSAPYVIFDLYNYLVGTEGTMTKFCGFCGFCNYDKP